MNVDNQLWSALMRFRQSERTYNADDWVVYKADHTIAIMPDRPDDDDVLALIASRLYAVEGIEVEAFLEGRIYLYFASALNAQTKMALKLYWPLIYTSKRSDSTYPFVITHMAQSLDGKICTSSGQSKWIGNQENLIHAHRLRACVEGVLVGGNTLSNDLPKLNVRHVKGPNPVRLFLTNSVDRYVHLSSVPNTQTFLLCNNAPSYPIPNVDRSITYNQVENPLQSLLYELKVAGIRSILIEGGPTTVSSFWESGCVDLAQIHIAPIILGGGKSFIRLSGIDKVSDGASLSNIYYTQMGEAMMITGACASCNWFRPINKPIHESESTLA